MAFALGDMVESTRYENCYGSVVGFSGIPGVPVAYYQVKTPKGFVWLKVHEVVSLVF